MEGGYNICIDNNRKITKEELLFLHLLNFKYNHEDYVVSDMVTESGIQGAIDCDLGYISRLLKKNEKKGFIRREKLRIKNKYHIQNAFFLTIRGERRALKINDYINNKK